jgi:large subunit ribosomal protein L25
VRNFGGVLELIRRDLEVECKARDIPSAIRVDVTLLKVHDVVHVREIPAIEGVILTEDPETIVVTVAAPTLQELDEPEKEGEEEDAAEPEVIGARKKEGEEEE